MVLVPPWNVPWVRVRLPEKLCVKPVPKFRVPPIPLRVRFAPVTAPVKVAVPPVLVMETVPVVVKPAIDCVAVPAIVIPPDPLVKVPVLAKFP